MRARYLGSILVAVTTLGVAACGDSGHSPAPAASPPVAPGPAAATPGPTTGQSAAAKVPTAPSPTRLLMREHFQKATEARLALISDDIEGARAAMAWLANNDPSQGELPASLRPHLDGMREKARAFATARTFTEAGDAFAVTLTQCGECHAAADRGPTFAEVPAPQGNELRDRMHKHAWAAERMWEGLVLRDQPRYDAAASSLADVVVRVDELPPHEGEPARIQAIADNVRSLAATGLHATDWPGRAQAYGRFLATCATCHRIMGVGARVGGVLRQAPPPAPLPAPQPAAP